MTIAKLSAGLFIVLALAACEAAVVTAGLGASLVTFVETDKTPADHMISFLADRDCSILYSINDAPYCKDKTAGTEGPGETETAATYCYRTLGEVSCYEQPDQRANLTTRLP